MKKKAREKEKIFEETPKYAQKNPRYCRKITLTDNKFKLEVGPNQNKPTEDQT